MKLAKLPSTVILPENTSFNLLRINPNLTSVEKLTCRRLEEMSDL